jgi:hypothetical protein
MLSKKLYKIYLSHSFMLFTTLFLSDFRYIGTAMRLKSYKKIATKQLQNNFVNKF